MNYEQLIEIAEMLAAAPQYGETRGRPQQMRLRKANSHAYYALFYALANSNADTLIGSTPAARASEEWTATHRALNHGTAKTQMSKKREMSQFPPECRISAKRLSPFRYSDTKRTTTQIPMICSSVRRL